MNQLGRRAMRVLPVPLGLALALGACGLDPFGPSSPADDLRAARAEWARQGITSYRYTVHRSCECLPEATAPARVEVRDGRTVSVVAATSVRQVRPEAFEQYDTVEELFAVIEEALARDPYRFSASYDERLGYPLGYSVDFDREHVDDEGGLAITEFEVIR
ncbi:MAG: DUF6174 domain-containing protein [Longimicrobiaceae bacterium]